jgi:hypothetical protein
MTQTLWIARSLDTGRKFYFIYAKEPNITKRNNVFCIKDWTQRGRLYALCPEQVHKYLPLLKLKKGEKKQFTITE